MTDFLASIGRALDSLVERLGAHGVQGFNAVYCVLGLFVFLMLCASVHTAVRAAFSSRAFKR